FGPVQLGPVTFSVFWMLLGVSLTIVGLQSFYMGCLARLLYDYSGTARRYWLNIFSYNRSMIFSGVLVFGGGLFLLPLCYAYWKLNLKLPVEIGTIHHMAITGLLCVMLGFMNFLFTLVLHAIAAALDDNEIRS
ncbi:MAG TPA: hypothetical protein VL981_07465, partial [Candidatus Methylacidiphilales bacterium]|nr:hypothetical protein [Candidatus Methylacidiphilales bacterium]